MIKENIIKFSSPNIQLNKKDYKDINILIKNGWVSIGKHVEELENIFKEKFNVKYAIACSNATSGLTISVKAAHWKNKKVAIPSFTWPSTLYAIESNHGNTPVFCDINKETWLMEPSGDYDVIMAVDTFGNEIKINHNNIIYDAAHGYGLPSLGHRGLAEVVSFSFTKIVTAMEGGIILTNDDLFAETAIELRRLSSRMEEINAIVAKRSIDLYDSFYKEKIEKIEYYKSNLDFKYDLQKIPYSTNHSVFSILLENQKVRNHIYKDLEINNIETKIYYEPLVFGLENTDNIYSRILSIPTHSKITEAIQKKIIDIMNLSYSSNKTPGKNYMVNSGYIN